MISICLCRDLEYKEMFSKNVRIYLDNKILEMIDIFQGKKPIDKVDLHKYRSIKNSQKRLIKSYKEIKKLY